MNPLKIVGLQAENVKRLVAVEIHPDGNLVQITGKNGQGKTSVLDAIWWALTGTTHIQAEPIRTGADKARIVLDLGEIVVKRTFNRVPEEKGGGHTTAITVETAEGSKFPTPQRMLDSLMGALTFDPLAFTRQSPKQQFDTLRALVPGVDFAGIEAANKADYDSRRDMNRVAKDRRAQAEGIHVPPNTPAELVDVSALMAQIDSAAKHNSDIQRRQERREQVKASVESSRAEAVAMRARAAELVRLAEADLAQAKASAATLDAKAAAAEAEAEKEAGRLAAAPELPARIDTAGLTAQIAGFEAINAAVRERARRDRLIAEAEESEAESASVTQAMERRQAAKEAAIAAASLPVEGIGFGDGVILLNNLPFDQASDAEQLRASIALAMAMNPTLRVIRVRDGSLLDEDAMALLAEMADGRDYQVWIERVDGSGKVGFVLEDGRLKQHALAAE